MNLEPDYKRTFPKVQYVTNGRTLICCVFIGAEVVEPLLDDGAGLIEFETKIVQFRILLEIAGAEENPKTKRRFYERVKDSVEYVIKNWWLPMFGWELLRFVWDIFCGM